MFKYLNLIIAFLYIPFGYAQQAATLQVQIGHAFEISRILISPDEKLLASYGGDHKIVFWDLQTSQQMDFKYIEGELTQWKFAEDKSKLYFGTSDSKVYEYDLANSSIEKTGTTSLLRQSDTAILTNGNSVGINGAQIYIFNSSQNKVIRSKTSDYFDQPFNHVIYSAVNNLIFAGCEDGFVYVFDTDLKLLKQWKEHLSGVNELCFFKNETVLVSASTDRSIIFRNIKTGEVERRLTGKSYPTYGASFNREGNQIIFGDQMGFVKSVDLKNTFLKFQSEKISIHPVTGSWQTKDSTVIIFGEDQFIRINGKNRSKKLKTIKNSVLRGLNDLFTKGFKLYAPQFSEVYHASLSADEKYLAYAVDSKSYKTPYFRIVNINTFKKSDKLILKGTHQVSNVYFLNNHTVFTYHSDSCITFWRFSENLKKIKQKQITFPFKIKKAIALDENKILILTSNSDLKIYNITTDHFENTNSQGMEMIYPLSDYYFCYTDTKYVIHFCEWKDQLIEKKSFEGHQDFITSIRWDSGHKKLVSTSNDATVRIWSLENENDHITIIPVGKSNAIYMTKDNYYMTTGKNLNAFGFKVKDDFFLPEQFDPFYNRPDLVLEKLGWTDSSTLRSYHKAYEKRLKRMGFSEDMLKSDFHLPEIKIKNLSGIPEKTKDRFLKFEIEARDEKYLLDRIQVYINDVPVFGSTGIDLKNENKNEIEKFVELELAEGLNKIQFSVWNQSGAESYRENVFIRKENETIEKPNLYLVTIGASIYSDERYNLTFASKDALDVKSAFSKNPELYQQIFNYTLSDKEVTRENILSLKKELQKANRNDIVIITVAGHGVLDKNFDYYLATHDMDFSNPSSKGLAYDELESLLDGIPPIKKVLFIDACHSGEIDKEEVQLLTANQNKSQGKIKFRDAGSGIQKKNLGLKTTTELMNELFADLRKGTGATVISSAGGVELAMESDEWKNGLFTYCLLHGLKDKAADANKDGQIMLSELQSYLRKEVTELSGGAQQPTSRIENLSMDFRVW